ncbi:MAG: multi-sensor hybrid histidine kinase [Caulobacteraceae bacterium]|nr:multi-sensor hybrid histidine kinase [Caulobacteraceae bacterium]
MPALETRATPIDPPPPRSVERSAARVLIVDDDERNAFAACQTLEDLGHELVVARSGTEALRRLLEGDYAVILLDLHMPDMDGYETARFIRSHPRTKQIPIVFVTAVFRDEAHLFQAYSAGAVDVVFKPVDPFILRSKVAVLAELHLKAVEISRQADDLRQLLAENARAHADRLAAERALRRTEERQEAIMRSLPMVLHSRRASPPFAPLFVSAQAYELFGFPARDFVDQAEFGFGRIHPDDVETVERALTRATVDGAYVCEFRWRCADGAYRHFLDQGVLAPSGEGEEAVIFGSFQDITDRKALEEKLIQARKMEAVGQLTGGVAHDFNNLLTVVLGNADMLLRKVAQDDPVRRNLSAIRQAADKGQSLTRQLLTFSRRDRMRPVVVDVNKLVADFLPLLQQAVGEGITITTALCAGALCVEVDAAHLESALLNLAVNARDAMEGGGELTLSTISAACDPAANLVHPRGYACIAVHDTGVGMSQETLHRVFEPFFTTKDIGKGSGLGLSQVYGFVQQSGGQVKLESVEGAGTDVRLFLPLTERAMARPAGGAAAEPVGGNETLLVVEDDPAVLALTVQMLKDLGYGVTTATNARSAMTMLKSKKRIDALMTDVVMPGGISGIQLAQSARNLRPDLPVLLTSGYVGASAPAKTEFPLIDKPYELATLASRLREVIDRGAEAAAS